MSSRDGMISMLTWLVRGIIAIALINLVTLVILRVAYAWRYSLEPRRNHRRARQRSFERILAETIVDNRATVPEPNGALESLAG